MQVGAELNSRPRSPHHALKTSACSLDQPGSSSNAGRNDGGPGYHHVSKAHSSGLSAGSWRSIHGQAVFSPPQVSYEVSRGGLPTFLQPLAALLVGESLLVQVTFFLYFN